MDEIKKQLLDIQYNSDQSAVESKINAFFPNKKKFPYLEKISTAKSTGQLMIEMLMAFEDEDQAKSMFGIQADTQYLLTDKQQEFGDSYTYDVHFTLMKVEDHLMLLKHAFTDDYSNNNENGYTAKFQITYFSNESDLQAYFSELKEEYIFNMMRDQLQIFLSFSDNNFDKISNEKLLKFFSRNLNDSVLSQPLNATHRFDAVLVESQDTEDLSLGMA